MLRLVTGVLLFGGPHLFSMLMPEARDRLRARMGEKTFKGAYSLVALAGLVLLGMAYLAGRSGPASLDMFDAPIDSARPLVMVMVFVGFILIFANDTKGYIRKAVKHPFSLGIALWSLGHLLVNGERAVVVIFGLFLLLSILDMVLSTVRNQGPTHAPSLGGDIRAVVVGVVLYLVFLFGFHPYVLNIPVM